MPRFTFQVYELRRVKMEYTVDAETRQQAQSLAEQGNTAIEIEDGEVSEVVSREVVDLICIEEAG